MIETIHISNYALISSIDISLGSGLNILTGETGAGKSIILGALSLLLGNRADTKAVRNPEQKSVIEATFRLHSPMPRLQECFERNDLDWNPNTLSLRREITPAGRSRAFVNDTPVGLPVLREVALQLVDIHSQHQNLLLADNAFQLSIIDSLAELGGELADYKKAYADYRRKLKAYQVAKSKLEESKANEEYIRFQLKQLTDAHLTAGEQEELEGQQSLLQNLAEVKMRLASAINALSDGEPSAVDLLKVASDSVDALPDAAAIDGGLAKRLSSALIEVRDIADTLSSADSSLQGDPSQLEAVEERLNELYTLQRRFNVDNLDALIRVRDEFTCQLKAIDNSDEALATLKSEAKEAKKMALDAAHAVSKRRKLTAKTFGEELCRRAAKLGMPNIQCDIQFEETPLSATGTDRVDFLFAFNKNQQPVSVAHTASGGEISRLMLTIKAIASEKMQMPAIIFDEVDTGVSGEIASRMGEMMSAIAQTSQVVAITHLPQVASKGKSHFKVYKQDDDQSTTTHIRELSPEERVDELALMLSGTLSSEAKAAAKSLLKFD